MTPNWKDSIHKHSLEEIAHENDDMQGVGGACDLEFHANTFEEMAQMSQKHGKDTFQAGDKTHLAAMNAMRGLMQSADGMAKWMEGKRREFEAKPDAN